MSTDAMTGSHSDVLIGESAAMRALRAEIMKAARANVKMLIRGETGTGKEVVARQIHAQSARACRPCVTVNCAGIPDSLLESELFGHMRGSFTGAYRDKVGLIQQAAGGTLFLDEIGEMSPRMQAAMLRFTETGEIQPIGATRPAARVEVRLITATHRDLRAQAATGSFREDLYYRLNVIQIQVPPLRERYQDILQIFTYYLARTAQEHGMRPLSLTPDAAQLLIAYAWPGNVRELRNVAERLVVRVRSNVATPDDLPTEIREAAVILPPLPRAGVLAEPEPAGIGSKMVATTHVEELWVRMEAGGDFWTVVYDAFKARELTRPELAMLVDRGLRASSGSYRALLTVFNLKPAEYKRLHAFLYQQRCNLPVAQYRRRRPRENIAAS